MLTAYEVGGRVFRLVPIGHGHFPNASSITVIIGKNGTGKSRLLRGVVAKVLEGRLDPALFERDERFAGNSFRTERIITDLMPSKVICVSTSPFDRFPLLRRGESADQYSYLGLRGLPSQNLGISYMSRIMSALILTASRDGRGADAVSNALDYLGYEPVIECTFVPSLSVRVQTELVNGADIHADVNRLLDRSGAFPAADGGYALRQIRLSDPDAVRHGLLALANLRERTRKPRFEVALNAGDLHVSADLDRELVLALISHGLLRLREVSFRKHGSEKFRMSEASSGEQSVVMGLLAIASQIEPGALVCIDEPEVCLHPEWQERYVHLLLRTFDRWSGCQFLIATHSPQIVAELPQANCFILDMESGEAIDARLVSRRSIDFQLAKVFQTPGYRNEYLSRLALSLFTRVGREKRFELEDLESLSMLEGIHEKLAESDPLRELIAALQAMRELYAGH